MFRSIDRSRAAVCDEHVEEVLAAEEIVAGAGMHLDDALEDLDQRDVERAAAEVEDEEAAALGALLQAIGERRRRRLVDQPLDLDAGEFARDAGRVALRVGEIGRHGDDGLGDCLAGRGLGIGDQALDDERRELLGPQALAGEDRLARPSPSSA